MVGSEAPASGKAAWVPVGVGVGVEVDVPGQVQSVSLGQDEFLQ